MINWIVRDVYHYLEQFSFAELSELFEIEPLSTFILCTYAENCLK